ncbi:MAG: hypothetical protein H7Z37_15705 [Pyrinomonadaceae bacterium]|nr:hypothetical protein [Pyrinomonadaceae bacterium]
MIGKLFIISNLFILITFAVVAQEKKSELLDEGFGVSSKPLNCESSLLRLEKIRSLIQTGTSEKSILILIARLGNKERNRKINRLRLENVRRGLTNTLGIVKPIVIAEGERVNGFGRVEVYLDGKFIGALLAQKNKIVIKCDIG